MEFATEIVGEKGFIAIECDLDSEVAGEALRRAFTKITERGKKTVVLDLSKVNIINSYGVGRILMCHQKLKTDGGVLMVKPLGGFVKETFELLMLDKLLPVDEG